MRTRAEPSYSPPLSVSAITGLTVLSALLGLLFAGNAFLQWLAEGTGRFLLVLAATLVAAVALEAVALVGLRRLKPWSWYAGVGAFGLAAGVALVVFVLELSLLAAGYLLVTALTAVYVYHKRPIYTPGTRARYDAYYGESPLEGSETIRRMRESDAAPLGVKLLFVVGTLASLFAVVQGLRLLWTGGELAALLGVLVILVAALQAVALYGLWMVERWAWFAGIALFGVATLFALLRVFLFPTPIAVVEFVGNGLIVVYLVHRKPLYAPTVTVDLTPR